MLKRLAAVAPLALLAIGAVVLSTAATSDHPSYRAAVKLARDIGSRPAGSRSELMAHRYVAGRFDAAGLDVVYTRFRVPGKGHSRNVVGVYRTPRTCLKIVMAHADSVPAGPGAVDNASGVGVVVALAPRLRAIRAYCNVWLVATGAEERPYTRHRDHLGARRLVERVKRMRLARKLRYALSLDMVGRERRFWLRSPRSAPRRSVEREVLAAGRERGVPLRWVRDRSSGASDHREFEMAGLRALVMEAWQGNDACYHSACDRWTRLDPTSLDRAQDTVEILLRRP